MVAEDYTGTGIAWGTVKGADKEWLKQMNRHLVKEDFAILIDGERVITAMENGHIHESNEALMKRSRQVHLELGEEFGWIKVPLQPTKDEMESLLWETVQLHLPPKNL